jgi:predicted nucleic acid-binding protein
LSLFVDTSVWSRALRRDDATCQEVDFLSKALEKGEAVFSTGLVLQELLQGFTGPKAHSQLVEYFSSLPFLPPDRRDHIEASELRNNCRSKGIVVGTIDALLTQLCMRHELTLLTTDKDFLHITKHFPLSVWKS